MKTIRRSVRFQVFTLAFLAVLWLSRVSGGGGFPPPYVSGTNFVWACSNCVPGSPVSIYATTNIILLESLVETGKCVQIIGYFGTTNWTLVETGKCDLNGYFCFKDPIDKPMRIYGIIFTPE